MNLTRQNVYQKGQKRISRGKARKPNAAELRHWEKILRIGRCMVGYGCHGRMTIHHCGTGAGGRKDHMKVLTLCHHHHQGDEGIDAKHNHSPQSKRAWQEKYGTEEELMQKLNELITQMEQLNDKYLSGF